MRITMIFVVLAIIVGSVTSIPTKNEKPVITKIVTEEDTVENMPKIDSTKLNKELLVNYLVAQKIPHPEVAYAIIRQESNMCSDIFKSNNNLFGMKQPGVRPTLSKGPKYGFASFEKWQHSVLDYKLYVEFIKGHKMTKEQYLRHLDRSYAHRGYTTYISKFFQEFYSYVEN